MYRLRNLVLSALVLAIAAGLLRDRAEQALDQSWAAGLLLPLRASVLVSKPADAAITMPLQRVRVGQIANTWRAHRSGGRSHEGQDIFAPKGTPVYSATQGIVIRIGQTGLGGNAVSVLGAGGRVYYYAHLARFADQMKVGEEVTTESVLGYVGNTGNARTTPPHLHFGVYDRRGALNPLPLLVNRAPILTHYSNGFATTFPPTRIS